MRLTILLLIAIPVMLLGQAPASQYIDIVHLHGKDAVSGTIITYEYGVRVVVVQDNGTTLDLDWDEVKRVNFRLDKEREADIIATQATEATPAPVAEKTPRPDRADKKFMHQLSGGISFGANQVTDFDFFFPSRRITIGGSAAYHLVRTFRKVNVGIGLDLSLMNHQLQEKVIAATGQFEYLFGSRKMRPFLRLEAGMTYPFGAGNRGGEVTERAISPLVHPSLGVEFGANSGPPQRLFVDLGYRFLTNRFTITDASLDVIQRKVNYQRLVLRAGIRF